MGRLQILSGRPDQILFVRKNFKLATEQPPAKRTRATTLTPVARLPVRSDTYPNSTGASKLPTWPTLLMKAMPPARSLSDRKPVGIV